MLFLPLHLSFLFSFFEAPLATRAFQPVHQPSFKLDGWPEHCL